METEIYSGNPAEIFSEIRKGLGGEFLCEAVQGSKIMTIRSKYTSAMAEIIVYLDRNGRIKIDGSSAFSCPKAFCKYLRYGKQIHLPALCAEVSPPRTQWIFAGSQYTLACQIVYGGETMVLVLSDYADVAIVCFGQYCANINIYYEGFYTSISKICSAFVSMPKGLYVSRYPRSVCGISFAQTPQWLIDSIRSSGCNNLQ